MISYIKGRLEEVLEDAIVVESGNTGIGYHIHVPLSVTENLPKAGSEVKIYTHMQLREDAVVLFGFLDRQDLEIFRQLIGVTGIGPKGALGILSALSPDTLRLAIISGDAKAISKAPGVGVKTAQRVILDLKDKIRMDDIAPQAEEPGFVQSALKGAGKEAVEALMALGYSASEASKAVSRVPVTEGMTAEDVLKASLRYLAF